MMLLAILDAAIGLLEFRSSLQVWACHLPFSGGRIRNVDDLAFRKAMLARDMSVWGGLHISPRGAPSRGAKLCTYLRWFARPDRISMEPYYELPLPVTKLRSIFHFRVSAHSLPIEQGRIEMPKVPRHLRRCTFCATNAIGNERHCVFDCPHFPGPSAAACRDFQGFS